MSDCWHMDAVDRSDPASPHLVHTSSTNPQSWLQSQLYPCEDCTSDAMQEKELSLHGPALDLSSGSAPITRFTFPIGLSLHCLCSKTSFHFNIKCMYSNSVTFPKGCYVMISTKLSGIDRFSGLIPYMLLKEVTEPGLLYAESIWFIYYPSTLTYS